MKRILMALTCILLSLTALAQSANMLSMARSELAKRGLDEGTDIKACERPLEGSAGAYIGLCSGAYAQAVFHAVRAVQENI